MGITRFKDYLDVKKSLNFLKNDIWRLRLRSLPRKKSFFIRQLRILLLAFRGFVEDQCNLRASALTFYSLLSIVPAMAMAFGVAKGFGVERLLKKSLLEKFHGQEEVVTRVIDFAHNMLENTRGGLIAGIGLLALFWLVIKLLSNIEKSFNEIWGVQKGRSLQRKFSDYLSVMLVCPILLIAASSATVFVTTRITQFTHKIAILGKVSTLITISLKLLPLAMLWILFTFVNIFMPNTKVKFKAALVGGIIGGTIFQLVQWAYISFQIGVSKYGAIYGSFAALPLFLVWLQMSWLIVLFGAEMSFAVQNVEAYEFEPDCLHVKPFFKKLLALRVTHFCVKEFTREEKPPTSSKISEELDIPIRLCNMLISELVESRVLCEVIGDENTKNNSDVGYLPGIDVCELTINRVLKALESLGSDDIPVKDTGELQKIKRCMEEFVEIIDRSDANLVLKNI